MDDRPSEPSPSPSPVPAEEDAVYKTKMVEFLGRRTPIILQNENGPCPLLAICNVLLLRNNLNLGPDPHEVPLSKLLSLLAATLIDSNSNLHGMDDAYVSNQQQNITDAMNLLHRLATGIDVNVHFRKINDFEFTRECTIFDLLDIALYHGWIVDPQDTDTATAIGSKSYNTLVGELVAFDTRKVDGEFNTIQEEDSVDFAAATTAALGVPSPSLSRAAPIPNDPSSNERKETDALEVVTPSLEGTEPIYEGEEHILDSGHSLFVDREPVYEGEVVLAAQADKMEDAYSVNVKHDIKKRCQLVKTFLENNASQLTIYGLFCLQEGLKERELCVFFRNNHFSTMFKFNGELYLLATDQGYISQPDLVWEKLNEVNGDTVFMTGNLKEFKAENQVNDTWNEQSAMTSTADYLAILEGSSPSSDLNSDLQLAIALQQQEFEQQPEQHQQRPSVNGRHQQQNQPPFVNGRSQLVTGPQRPRSSNSTPKSDSKSKDKCILM